MSVTVAQVQDLQTTVKDLIDAYSFPLYGEVPQAYKENSYKFARNIWIELKETTGNVVQAANGAVIMFEDTCKLEIRTPNRTDLNKIYADILNMLVSSQKGYYIKKTRDIPLKDKYRKILTIELKDI